MFETGFLEADCSSFSSFDTTLCFLTAIFCTGAGVSKVGVFSSISLIIICELGVISGTSSKNPKCSWSSLVNLKSLSKAFLDISSKSSS